MYEVAVGQVKGGNPKKGRETLSELAVNTRTTAGPQCPLLEGRGVLCGEGLRERHPHVPGRGGQIPPRGQGARCDVQAGVVLPRLKDKTNARIILDLVPKKYPKSKAAELAKKKLKEIR